MVSGSTRLLPVRRAPDETKGSAICQTRSPYWRPRAAKGSPIGSPQRNRVPRQWHASFVHSTTIPVDGRVATWNILY